MKREAQIGLACLLALLAAGGVWHGVRAGLAQALYYRAKYGAVRHDRAEVFRLCETAHRLYPHNYYFCIWTAEMAYYARPGAGPEDDRFLLSVASRWCDAGLRLNPYKSQLRMLKARLLALSSPADGARYWERYVDWHFWEPAHHAALAEFRAAAGDFDGAMESLKWAKGSPYYAAALRSVHDAWQRESVSGRLPPAPSRTPPTLSLP